MYLGLVKFFFSSSFLKSGNNYLFMYHIIEVGMVVDIDISFDVSTETDICISEITSGWSATPHALDFELYRYMPINWV